MKAWILRLVGIALAITFYVGGFLTFVAAIYQTDFLLVVLATGICLVGIWTITITINDWDRH